MAIINDTPRGNISNYYILIVMEKTQIVDFIGMPIDWQVIVADPSDQMKDKIRNILGALEESSIGEFIWAMPLEQLHFTLCTCKEEKLSKTEYEIISSIITKHKPINVIFDKIEVSPAALIIKGDDSGIFDKIRKEIIGSLPKVTYPNIVHCTIARYTNEIELHEVKKAVSKLSISCEERIDKFHLRNLRKLPMQGWENIFEF